MAVVGYYCPCECSTRTFYWCDQKWFVKHSPTDKIGPGPSTFDIRNVELGENGSLRLWVRCLNSASKSISSAEIQTTSPLGYGTYQVDLCGSLSGDRWNHLVFGFCTYDLDDETEGSRELDIEIGKFDGNHPPGGVFSNYNDARTGPQLKDIHPSRNSSRHRLSIDWRPDLIIWSLVDLEFGSVLDEFSTSTSVPSCQGACFIMNLWQFKNNHPVEKEESIILENFNHTPLNNVQQKELNFIHSLLLEDNRKIFAKGKKYKNVKIVLKTVRRMTNVKLWIDQPRENVVVEYPTGNGYSLLNSDVEVKGGQTDFATITLTFLYEHLKVLPVVINCDQFKSPSIYPLPVQIICG